VNSIIPFETRWNYKIVTWPIMALMVAFIIWATLSEIDESVRGEGRVVPSGQTKIIQHLEGGIIAEILVKEGDIVKKGDPLFKLSQAFFLSDQNEKKIDLYALLAQETRLRAEIAEAKKVNFDSALEKHIPNVIENEKNIFIMDRQTFDEELSLLQDAIDKKRYSIMESENKLQNLALELAIAGENVSIQERLVTQGASSRKMYLQELAKKQSIITQMQSIEHTIPVIKEEQQEATKKFNNYKGIEHSKQLKEMSKVRVAINKLLEKDKANSDRETRKLIKSPVNGEVNKLHFHTVGGIIKPGDEVVEITPIDGSLMIEGQIKTSDRGLIWEGQKVSVDITAFDFSRYGSLEGILVDISADSFVDNSGNSFYEVKIKTTKSSFGKEEQVLPGMVANINILTGKKSVLEYILKPLKDIKKKSLKEH